MNNKYLNQIINSDSISFLDNLESNSIDLIISDIPYGISLDDWDVLHDNKNSAYGGASIAQSTSTLYKRRGKPLNGWSEADKNIPKEYQNWCDSWASKWFKVLKPGASCFIFAGRRFAHRCIVSLEDAGFTFKDMISWNKSSAAYRGQRISKVFERRSDFENAIKWTGWRTGNLRPLFEPILWFQKPYKQGETLTDNVLKHGVGAWNDNVMDKYIKFNQKAENNSNIFRVKNLEKGERFHEAQKPIALMKLLIELTINNNDAVILDPFAGSGSTCVAAKELEKQYIGIELNKDYCEIAEQRLNEINFIQKGLF
ncbi:site-specific DNA-methyltransferase [Staphylococcus haemolyticus]|uniref:DNA-methyltransferase n=1 Tax=Staphylococcus TaxID=1279 RepID=UPI000E69B13C|nr:MULTISPECIES: site-specific DNA-methyltransferase [Staphylococcus]MCE5050803.1 site-specific DNA-methyltransferase [Staphylococcus haemolyticus]RIO60010.1 site-specific DNA-methyltransferase [Staphylococcus hominis]